MQFEILGAGTVEIEDGNITYQNTRGHSNFFQDYRTNLLHLPRSLVDAIKTSIKQPGRQIPFKSIYKKTLEEVFSKIQIQSLQRDQALGTSLIEESQGKNDNLANVKISPANGLSYHITKNFIENGSFIRSINNQRKNAHSNSQSQILPQIQEIKLSIEWGELDQARELIASFLHQYQGLDISNEITERMQSYTAFLECIISRDNIWAQYNDGFLELAAKGFANLGLIARKRAAIDPIFNSLCQDIQQKQTDMERVIKTHLMSVQRRVAQISDFVSQSKYYNAVNLFLEVELETRHVHHSTSKNLIGDCKMHFNREFEVYCALLFLKDKRFSRVHLSEVVDLVNFPPSEVENVIKILISKKAIEANYDPSSKGLEFHFFSAEIDDLFLAFQQSELFPDAKKHK